MTVTHKNENNNDFVQCLQFTGQEEYSYNDVPGLAKDNQAQSAIVTGCSAWTIYQVLTSMQKIKQITKQTLVPNPGPHPRVNWIRQQSKLICLDHSESCSGVNSKKKILTVSLWQYGLWIFQMGYKKLERFWHKNQPIG